MDAVATSVSTAHTRTCRHCSPNTHILYLCATVQIKKKERTTTTLGLASLLHTVSFLLPRDEPNYLPSSSPRNAACCHILSSEEGLLRREDPSRQCLSTFSVDPSAGGGWGSTIADNPTDSQPQQQQQPSSCVKQETVFSYSTSSSQKRTLRPYESLCEHQLHNPLKALFHFSFHQDKVQASLEQLVQDDESSLRAMDRLLTLADPHVMALPIVTTPLHQFRVAPTLSAFDPNGVITSDTLLPIVRLRGPQWAASSPPLGLLLGASSDSNPTFLTEGLPLCLQYGFVSLPTSAAALRESQWVPLIGSSTSSSMGNPEDLLRRRGGGASVTTWTAPWALRAVRHNDVDSIKEVLSHYNNVRRLAVVANRIQWAKGEDRELSDTSRTLSSLVVTIPKVFLLGATSLASSSSQCCCCRCLVLKQQQQQAAQAPNNTNSVQRHHGEELTLAHEAIRRGKAKMVGLVVSTLMEWHLDGLGGPCLSHLNDPSSLAPSPTSKKDDECCRCLLNILTKQDHQGHSLLHAAFRYGLGGVLCETIRTTIAQARSALRVQFDDILRLQPLQDGVGYLPQDSAAHRTVLLAERTFQKTVATFNAMIDMFWDLLQVRDVSGVTALFYVATRTQQYNNNNSSSSSGGLPSPQGERSDAAATLLLLPQCRTASAFESFWSLLLELRGWSSTPLEADLPVVREHVQRMCLVLYDIPDTDEGEQARSYPIHTACRQGHWKLTDALLSYAQTAAPHRLWELLNRADGNGNTALMLAATKGHAEVCRLLLQQGTVHIPRGLTAPVDAAARCGHVCTVEVLMQHGLTLSPEMYLQLTSTTTTVSPATDYPRLKEVLDRYVGCAEYMALEDPPSTTGAMAPNDRAGGGGGTAPRLVQLWEVYRGALTWAVLGYLLSIPLMWFLSSM